MTSPILQRPRSALAVFLVLLSLQLTATTNSVWSDDNGATGKMSELLRPWSGPYGGVPPWDRVRPEEFVENFDAAIRLAESDIEAIANNPDPPTLPRTHLEQ